jgi:pilus assembly protein CpaE
LNLLCVVKTPERREDVLTVLGDMHGITSSVVLGDLNTVWKNVKKYKPNSIILLEIDKDDKNIAESLHSFKNAYGDQYHFIIISEKLDHTAMLQLLRVGVSDFLPIPLTIAEMRESVARVAAHNKIITEGNTSANKIITFAHASGGMGATTLAVNAATLISQANKDKILPACLLDLDLQFGGASVYLDLPGYSPILDLLGKPDRLDREMLNGMMMRHSSGLLVLTAPEIPMPMDAVSSELVDQILQIAQKQYEYVVVDMPQTMTQWTDTVFRKSKVIYVVMQMTVPSIRQLKRWFSVMEQEGMGGLPIKVVVNRHTSFNTTGNNDISIAQASEALGRKIDFVIPNDYALISNSLNQGEPAVSISPKSKFTHQLKAMLHEVVDELEMPPAGDFLGLDLKKLDVNRFWREICLNLINRRAKTLPEKKKKSSRK